MAQMYRSKKPLSGALFIENPRPRKRNFHHKKRKNAWSGEPERHRQAALKGARQPASMARAQALRQAIAQLKSEGRKAGGKGGTAARNRRSKKILATKKGRSGRSRVPYHTHRTYDPSDLTWDDGVRFRNPKRNPKRKKTMRKKKSAKLQPIKKLMDFTKTVQKKVEKVPVAKFFAWAIPSAALGYGIYYVHTSAAPRVVPTLEKIPFVGGWVSRNPFLSTALVLGPTLAFVAKKGYLNKTAATTVGLSAVAIGVALDKAAPLAVQSADTAGFGDGMRYLVGKDTIALGPLSNYEDASMADAAVCPTDMTQQEVSAALSGAYMKCFPAPPARVRTRGTRYSRHAGHPGHRYGWLIKMVGPARFQQIAQLPPRQRHEIIQALKQNALATLQAELNQHESGVISASVPLDGTANGFQGANSATYGALMFAGGGV